MEKLLSVEFYFERSVKLSKDWTEIESTVEGATPLATVQVIQQNKELEGTQREVGEQINPGLERRQKPKIESLTAG